MHKLIKQQIEADFFQQRFPNDGQRFVAWYLRNILFRDMNETRDDITDGSGDKQIDAIIIDDDRSLAGLCTSLRWLKPLHLREAIKSYRTFSLSGYSQDMRKVCKHFTRKGKRNP